MNSATNNKIRQAEGFTLIELVLSMAFIGVLLLAIAMTIIQISAIYNKGITLKELNVSGREVSEAIENSVARSSVFSLATDYVTAPIGATGTAIAGGRLCLGTESYIWNYGRVKPTSAAGTVKYASTSTKKDDWVGLVRVADPTKSYCALASGALVRQTIVAADVSKAEELLKPGDHELAIHNLALSSSGANVGDTLTGQRLYTLNLTIGTNKYFESGTNRYSTLNADQTACLVPGETYADPDYCAVTNFTVVLRTGSRFN